MYYPDKECRAMIAALKDICKLKNISPYSLSKESGISTSTISYIMNGKTKPQVCTILMLCHALGVTIGELFENRRNIIDIEEYNIKEQCVTQEEADLLNCYRHLSDKKRELLKIYVNMLSQYRELNNRNDE